ncbi:MAG: TolB family protein [Anaerolineales bacterium]
MRRTLFSMGWLVISLAACSMQLGDVTPAITPLPAASALPPQTTQLQGRLLYTLTQQGVWQYDFATDASTQLFQAEDPQRAWAASVTAAPDGSTILMAYAPPPSDGEIQFGYTDLYLLPTDGSAPRPFLERADPRESLFTPTWSPDGRYIYYSRLKRIPLSDGQSFDIRYDIEHIAYPDGQPETVVINAFWPRLSADGTRLVYVSVEPATFANGLVVADADGYNAVSLLTPEQFIAVDSPLFSPDEQYVLFSAVSNGGAGSPAIRSVVDWLSGVKVVEAHSVPSDWWRMPVTGGVPEQLTRIFDVGLYGDFAPDGQHLAFISATGLSVMRPDGSGLQKILPLTNAAGTLEWLP